MADSHQPPEPRAGDFRYLGNIAASEAHSVLLSCAHCNVYWGGCAAESFCPECHAPKGYYVHDRDVCYCEQCMPRTETP